MGLKRLDKLIALNCNVSRKEARQLIKDSAVTLNGRVCLRAEELIDVESDEISVEGYNFTLKEHVYIMMNKPDGVISSTEDGNDKTVLDLLPEKYRKMDIFPCGRLDKNTLGLLILTNNGGAPVITADPSLNITDDVLARLNEEYVKTKNQKSEDK